MKIRYLLICFNLFFSQFTIAQSNWGKINSIEDVCAAYPAQIKSIFQKLNLDYPGLEKVKKTFAAYQIMEACKELLT